METVDMNKLMMENQGSGPVKNPFVDGKKEQKSQAKKEYTVEDVKKSKEIVWGVSSNKALERLKKYLTDESGLQPVPLDLIKECKK